MPAFFTISGTIDGRAAAVVWQDGELAGDDVAVARVFEEVGLGSEVYATPTGPYVIAALEPAEVALLTIVSIFDQEDLAIEGVIPTKPASTDDPPRGATP